MKMKMANDVLVVEVEESMATVTDILVEAFQAAAVATSSSRQDALLTAVVVAAAAAANVIVVVVVVAAVKARKQKEVPAACRNVCRMVQTLHRRLARDIQMEEGSRNLEDHAKANREKERRSFLPIDLGSTDSSFVLPTFPLLAAPPPPPFANLGLSKPL